MCIDRVGALLYYRIRHYYNYVHCTYIVNFLSAKRLASMHMFMCTLYTCSHGHVSNNLCRTFCYDVLRYLRFPKLKKIQFILIFRFFKDIRFNIIPIISHVYFFKKRILLLLICKDKIYLSILCAHKYLIQHWWRRKY